MKTEHGIEYDETQYSLKPAKQGGGWKNWVKLQPRFAKQLKTREFAKLKRLLYALEYKLDKENIVLGNGLHYFSIKYKAGSGRSRLWLVLKYSEEKLFLWLRVDPATFHDEKHLTEYYDDSSKKLGNRRLDFMEVELEDIIDLVRQSYEFRKVKDFEKRYSVIVARDE